MTWKELKDQQRQLLACRRSSLQWRSPSEVILYALEAANAWWSILRHRSLLNFIIYRATRQEGLRAPIFRYYLRLGVRRMKEHGQELEAIALQDLMFGFKGDPAVKGAPERVLWLMNTKGFLIPQIQRMYHALWLSEDRHLQLAALRIYQALSECTSVEIHPGARIGREFFIDHAHQVVIGETAIVGEDNPTNAWEVMFAHIWILHGVTLGGSSGEEVNGRRHPHIFPRVFIGAGAKVIGTIRIGYPHKEGQVEPNEDGFAAYIGAGAVVRDDIRAGETFVGPKARLVGQHGKTLGPVRPADLSAHDYSI